MKDFKRWLLPVAIICLLLTVLIGGSCAPQSLGEALDPSGNPFAHRFSDVTDIRTATFVVAASDSVHKYEADYFCDGTDDHIQIQQAIDALPATGGEVLFLDGTYNIEVSLVLDSYQTLRGCGRNTILTTTTADLIFLSAVGGAGTEKTGIVIADLQIDGGAVSTRGVHFEYVDYSFIQNVYSRRHGTGILLKFSDFNTIVANTCQENDLYGIYLATAFNSTISGNTCQENAFGIYLLTAYNNTISGNTCPENSAGIYLKTAENNTVSGNTCMGNADYGIYLKTAENSAISGNTCQGNTYGIYLDTAANNNTVSGNTCPGNTYGIHLKTAVNNTVSGNTCMRNTDYGIYLLTAHNNAIIGNTLTENSQSANNAYDDICLESSDYNNIQANICRAGILANKPRYGINISNATSDGNLVTNNDIYNDGFGTGSFNDAGTGTVTVAGNRT